MDLLCETSRAAATSTAAALREPPPLGFFLTSVVLGRRIPKKSARSRTSLFFLKHLCSKEACLGDRAHDRL